MYNCSGCGLAVIVYDAKGAILDKPIRACNCKAPITVSMDTWIKGKGGVRC